MQASALQGSCSQLATPTGTMLYRTAAPAQPMHSAQQQPRHALRWQPPQQQQPPCPWTAQRPQQVQQQLVARASKRRDDKQDGPEEKGADKADFSAYWSLKFRNFFSKRREYLDKASKRQDPPKVLTAINERIEEQQRELDRSTDQLRERRRAQQLAAAKATLAQMTPEEVAETQALVDSFPSLKEVVLQDIDAARAAAVRRRVKLALTVPQLRAALRAVVLAPLTLPAEAHRRWTALFASQRYENFLMAEGERIWFWRNRMENERWFWEMLFWDRIVVPLAFSIAYQAIVPNNLLWAVLVPLSFIMWQTGSLPPLLSIESLVILVFGVYGKCWGQITGFANLLFCWA